MSTKKKLNKIIRIPKDSLYISPNAVAVDVNGIETYLAWPTLDNVSWLKEVLDFTKEKKTPRHVVCKVGKKTLRWKLACYTEDGWWYRHDEKSSKVEYETRLFIPQELKFHPDFSVNKKSVKKKKI
jgi:hypothetical protein